MTSKSASRFMKRLKPLPEPWQPHDYQKRSVKWLLQHACAALFLDPGLGKTSVALSAFRYLKLYSDAQRALVIAPLRVCYSVWPEEVQKWREFSGMKIAILHGPKKEQALREDADLFIINPEGLEWLLGPANENLSQRFRDLKIDTLIIDELSKFKHIKTKRFKIIKRALPSFDRRWGLTGSPAANGLMDLFGECLVLDLGKALGKFITHYRNQFFIPLDMYGWEWRLRDGAEKEIYKRLEPLALSLSANEYLKLPKLITKNVYIDLPTGPRGFYDQLENDLIAKIKDKVVVAANAAAASTKCRQVTSGAVYLEEVHGVNTMELHDVKFEALEDLVEELQGQPLLVAYEFQHEIRRLRERAAFKKTPFIGGGVPVDDAKKIIKKWNAGELPVLFGQPQSIAHGLNLQGAAAHVCWLTLTWNFEDYDQLIRRIWRQGSRAKTVFVYHLLARDTIDEAVLSALQRKRHGQDALFEALKELTTRRLGSAKKSSRR